MKIRTIIGASILLLSGQVNAAVINVVNTNTEYGVGFNADLQGRDWLSLDATAGFSRNEVDGMLDTIEGGGWEYATRTQTETLLGSLWGRTISGWSTDNLAGATWFGENFNFLFFQNDSNSPVNYQQSNFLFGEDGSCSSSTEFSCLGVVAQFDNSLTNHQGTNVLTKVTGDTYQANSGAAGYFREIQGLNAGLSSDNGLYTKDIQQFYTGSMLVRQVSPIPVPEPPALLLFGIGLLGLIGFSKRKSAMLKAA